MLKIALIISILPSFYFAQAQNTTPKCRLTKITMIEKETTDLALLKKDTSQVETYFIEYKDDLIQSITLKRNFVKRSKPKYVEKLSFQRTENQLLIFKNQDSLILVKFNEKKQATEIRELTRGEVQIIDYDEKGRLMTFESKKKFVETTSSFYYENKEVKSITHYFNFLSKTLETYDDFNNPFYQKFEFMVIKSLGFLFFNNCIAKYKIDGGDTDIEKTQFDYIYNSQKFPIEVIESSKYFSGNILTYHRRVLFEYDCQE